MTDRTDRPISPPNHPQRAERRRHPRHATDLPATLWLGPGVALFGRLVNLSQGGACVVFSRAISGRPGQRVVLEGEAPLRHGFDARVVAADDRHWRLAFDSALVDLSAFKTALRRAAEAAS